MKLIEHLHLYFYCMLLLTINTIFCVNIVTFDGTDGDVATWEWGSLNDPDVNKDLSPSPFFIENDKGKFKEEVSNVSSDDKMRSDITPLFNNCLEMKNKKKYYTIDTEKKICSETCIRKSLSWIYKILFNSNLNESKDVENICAVSKYSKFLQLDVIKKGPFQLKFDVYTFDSKTDDDTVDIVTFDGVNPLTTWNFREVNDPVMGGQSTGSFEIIDAIGIFKGHCAIVPSLKAPGFCKAETTDGFGILAKGIDARGKSHVILEVRSKIAYDGFKVAFTADTFTSFFSFKANVAIPVSEDFITVFVPFTDFSNKWSPATGEAKVKCSDDPNVCMTEKNKKDIAQVGIWAEGHEGEFNLEIKSIRAGNLDDVPHFTTPTTSTTDMPSSTTTTTTTTSPNFRHCKVQNNIRFNVEKFDSIEQILPIEGDKNEILADAICCDSRFKFYAEPQFLYEDPEVTFLDQVKTSTKENPIIFYDSSCGIPLFKTPVNRSIENFISDTMEHGWPSFRDAEVFHENIIILDNNRVVSKCGTNIGSFLPDEVGDRYCIDLVCISGTPQIDF